MTPLFWILFLIVISISMSVAVMLGTVRPITPAFIAGLVGLIYANILETNANFTAHIVEPGVNTLWGLAEPSFYNMSTAVLLIALIFVGFVSFVNLVVSWYNDEPLSLWR